MKNKNRFRDKKLKINKYFNILFYSVGMRSELHIIAAAAVGNSGSDTNTFINSECVCCIYT